MYLKNIILSKLFAIGAVKRGNFVLKSGRTSPIYIDMRVLIGYPKIWRYLLDYLLEKFPHFFDGIDSVTGIHFGGLPLANYISFERVLPQIYIRDSQKGYGTGKRIEGELRSNLLLIDDVLTTGGSINTALHILDDYSTAPRKILVIVDRSEEKPGFNYYSLFTLSDILNFSHTEKFFENTISNKLYQSALEKKSNIIFSADYDRQIDILHAIECVGPHIIGVKLHADLIQDFDENFIKELQRLKEKWNLVIIEDRKFADIPAIVLKQLRGPLKIEEWADAVTVHPIVGKPLIDAIPMNVILVVEMSSQDNLINGVYTSKSLEWIERENVAGIVCQTEWKRWVHPFQTATMSPGIHLEKVGDSQGQTWKNSAEGLFWIVGRGISEACIIEEAANEYQIKGFNHFKNF